MLKGVERALEGHLNCFTRQRASTRLPNSAIPSSPTNDQTSELHHNPRPVTRQFYQKTQDMPHSTEMESRSSPSAVKDEPMEDEATIPNGISSATNGDDVDMDEAQDSTKPEEDAKKDVKLEDLFADVDSDEEFPSSAPVAQPGSSSPSTQETPT